MATSLEVTFAAYLAVLLGTWMFNFLETEKPKQLRCRKSNVALCASFTGTLLPTLFLIVLYLNSEARRIGDFTEEFE